VPPRFVGSIEGVPRNSKRSPSARDGATCSQNVAGSNRIQWPREARISEHGRHTQSDSRRTPAARKRCALEKGDGYFYFWSGEANDWLDKIVNVPTLSSLTLEQWVEEFNSLKKLNHEILHTRSKVSQESGPKRTRKSKS
jgi:hypothetical protein